MARRVVRLEARTAQLEGVAVLEHAHARRGDGLHAAVERVEALGPVDLRRARHELGGVDQVARGTRVGEQRGVWAAGQERARASRVVEVRVRHGDIAHLLGAQRVGVERGEQPGQRVGRVRLDKGTLFAGDAQIAGGELRRDVAVDRGASVKGHSHRDTARRRRCPPGSAMSV